MFRPIACTCSLYLAIQLFSCKYVTIKLSCSISNKKVTYQLNSVLRSPRRDMQRKKIILCARDSISITRCYLVPTRCYHATSCAQDKKIFLHVPSRAPYSLNRIYRKLPESPATGNCRSGISGNPPF